MIEFSYPTGFSARLSVLRNPTASPLPPLRPPKHVRFASENPRARDGQLAGYFGLKSSRPDQNQLILTEHELLRYLSIRPLSRAWCDDLSWICGQAGAHDLNPWARARTCPARLKGLARDRIAVVCQGAAYRRWIGPVRVREDQTVRTTRCPE